MQAINPVFKRYQSVARYLKFFKSEARPAGYSIRQQKDNGWRFKIV
jgi:hypothetical protein